MLLTKDKKAKALKKILIKLYWKKYMEIQNKIKYASWEKTFRKMCIYHKNYMVRTSFHYYTVY